jgi:serine/threonine protein kinase
MNMKEVVGELTAWSAVQGSKHVVRLVSAMAEGRRVFMVMERCEGSILTRVFDRESPGFWALESRRVLKEMLLGVQACHCADIVHRDIKPENFLVASDGSTVKLCDFGLAARMPRSGQLQGLAGTIPFTSPEMLRGSRYGKATDMWSYGVTAYKLSFGVFPFPFCRHSLKIMFDLPARCLAGEASRRCRPPAGAPTTRIWP